MSKNFYTCYKCGKKFQSIKDPKKVSKNSKLLGYICEGCYKKHEERILKSFKCSKCSFSLKEVRPYDVKTEVDVNKDIWVKMKYVCPKCSSQVRIKNRIGSISHLEINLVMLERYQDEIIKKIHDLYKYGFKIIGKELHFDQKQNKHTFILAKGNEIKKLEIVDASNELSYFWAQIQFVYDNNLRRIATLIEPNKYWKNTVIPQKIKDVSIKISGYTFTEFEILTIPKENVQNPLFRFNISLDNDKNKNFLKIDFREPLSFYNKGKLMFTGYITTFMKGFNILDVICQGLSGDFLADKINVGIKSKNNRYKEFIAFLLDYFERSYHIEGLDNEIRAYDIIIPINGLNISDKLEIGNCYIINKLPENEFLNKGSFPQKGNFVYLSLNRDSFYNALFDGMKFIQGAIDLINFRLKIPTFLGYYHYFDQRINIKLGGVVYIVDKKHDIELVTQLPMNEKPDYKRGELIQDYFKPILKLGKELIKPNEELSIEEEKLFWVLRYLISAENETNRIAAFLDLYIALEFSLNRFGVKINKKFSKLEIEDLRNYFNGFLPIKEEELENLRNGGKIGDEDYKRNMERYTLIHKRLVQLINSNFNQISLQDQMNAILEKYDLELNERETEIFKKARQKRNEIVHGKKDLKPTKEEYNIISKIIYFLIRNALIDDFQNL